MAFSLDPVEYFRKTSGWDSERGDYFMPQGTSGMMKSARNYRNEFSGGDEYGPVLPDSSIQSGTAAGGLLGDQLQRNEQEYTLASNALGYEAELDAARKSAAAKRSAMDEQASANRTGAVIGAVGGIGAAVVGGLI